MLYQKVFGNCNIVYILMNMAQNLSKIREFFEMEMMKKIFKICGSFEILFNANECTFTNF